MSITKKRTIIISVCSIILLASIITSIIILNKKPKATKTGSINTDYELTKRDTTISVDINGNLSITRTKKNR